MQIWRGLIGALGAALKRAQGLGRAAVAALARPKFTPMIDVWPAII
jgi:hypothetical protein